MKFLTNAEYAARAAARVRQAEDMARSARERFEDSVRELENARASYLSYREVLQRYSR